jgi:hypothetical protein
VIFCLLAKMAQASLGSLLSIGILPILLHDRLAVSRNAMCTMYCRSTLEISSIYDPLLCLVFHLTLFWWPKCIHILSGVL